MRIRGAVMVGQSRSVHFLSMLACVCFGQLWIKCIVILPYVSVSYQKTLGKSLKALTVAAMKTVRQAGRPVGLVGTGK
jgi:hypothetical protein